MRDFEMDGGVDAPLQTMYIKVKILRNGGDLSGGGISDPQNTHKKKKNLGPTIHSQEEILDPHNTQKKKFGMMA